MKKKAFVFTIMISILLLNLEPVNAKIYKWKDSNGVTHFSEDPPPSQTQGVSTMESVKTSVSTDIHVQTSNSKRLTQKLQSIKLHSGQIE